MRTPTLATTAAVLLSPLIAAFATEVAIEPDSYPENTPLTNVSSLAILRTANGTNVPSDFFTVEATGITDSAPTGIRVFGHDGIGFWPSSRRLRVDFLEPADAVSIKFTAGSAIVTERGTLEAYNVAGDLLESYLTQPLLNGQVEIMDVASASADISFVVAYTPQSFGSFGILDALTFNTVPPTPPNLSPKLRLKNPKGRSLKSKKLLVSGTAFDLDGLASITVKVGRKSLRVRGLEKWRTKTKIRKAGKYKIIVVATDTKGASKTVRKTVVLK